MSTAAVAYVPDIMPFRHGFPPYDAHGARAGATTVCFAIDTGAMVSHGAAARFAALGAFVSYPPTPSVPCDLMAHPLFMTRAQRIAAHIRM